MSECLKCNRKMLRKGTPSPNRHGAPAGPDGLVMAAGRGLCAGCLRTANRTGEICDYPRRNGAAMADFVEDVIDLRSYGLTDKQICERMKMKWNTFDIKRRRAQNRGFNV